MKNLISFYFRHKNLCLLVATIVAMGAVFYVPELARAQDVAADPETGKLLNDINRGFIYIMKGASMILWPVLLMIGSLLDNDLVFGGAMGERLLDVWVQVRNLVNIIFVLVLLAIALFNVLGRGEELGGYSLGFKAVLPKFVLALIAVNFSFLGIKVLLDFTNVMTGAVFAIPSTVNAQEFNMKEEIKVSICGSTSSEVPLKPLFCKGGELSDKANAFFNRLDRTNITVAYAIRFGRTPQLKFIREGLTGVTQLAFNILFNTILFIVYAVSFVALFIVLLFRLVALWLVVALSPLLALGIVLPNLKELGGGSKLQEKFVKSATAPLVIGFVLSLGYVMLDGFSADKSIHGALLSSNSLDAIDPNSIPTDIEDLQQLMIAIGSIAVVWLGVFSATEGTVGDSIINSIKDYTSGFGKFMFKLPMYAQVLPTGKKTGAGGEENISFGNILGRVEQWKQNIVAKGSAPIGGASKESRLATLGNYANDANSFAKKFADDLALAWDAGGRQKIKEFAGRHNPALGAAISTGSPKEFAESIYNSARTNNPAAIAYVEALRDKKINNPAELESAIDRAQGNEPTSSSTSSGSTKPDPIKQIKDGGDSATIAKQLNPTSSTSGWTTQEVDELKRLNRTNENLLEQVIKKDDAGNLDHTDWSVRNIQAVSTLFNGLKPNTNVQEAQHLIATSGLKKGVVNDVITLSNLQPDIKTSLLDTRNAAAAAITTPPATPPPGTPPVTPT